MNKQLKETILNSLEDIKAVNPVVIDVKNISSLTDFMVIASGTSNRHLAAMSERVLEGLKENNVSGIRIEGQEETNGFWSMLEITIHLMSSDKER